MVQCGERGKVEIRIFWNQNPNKACNIRYLFVFISPFPFGGLYHLCQSANSLLIWPFLPLPRDRCVPPERFAKRRAVRRSRAPMAIFVLAAAPSLTLALGSISAACDLGKLW